VTELKVDYETTKLTDNPIRRILEERRKNQGDLAVGYTAGSKVTDSQVRKFIETLATSMDLEMYDELTDQIMDSMPDIAMMTEDEMKMVISKRMQGMGSKKTEVVD